MVWVMIIYDTGNFSPTTVDRRTVFIFFNWRTRKNAHKNACHAPLNACHECVPCSFVYFNPEKYILLDKLYIDFCSENSIYRNAKKKFNSIC